MTISFPTEWPAKHPERIQLYSLATPNGKKAGVMLEESELPYEAHKINIMAGDQFKPGFVAVNPNSKIPCMIDPDGPGGKPHALMESGAMLIYLAEKSGRLFPTEPIARSETLQWLFFQMASIGPMIGQFGHFFKFAKGKTDDYGANRYSAEAKRLLAVLENRLSKHEYLAADEYTIADIATFPWITALDFYEAKEHLEYASFPSVQAWVQRCLDRPAVQRGVEVCGF